MTHSFTARALTRSDVQPMRHLLDLFGHAFESPETYTAAQPTDSYLLSLLGSELFIAVAVFEGEEMLGGLAGYVLPKFERERTEFYIYDLAVAETHRRRGVATAAINELQRIAAARGIGVIFVQADLEDDPAIALYTRFGPPRRVLHFDIPPAT